MAAMIDASTSGSRFARASRGRGVRWAALLGTLLGGLAFACEQTNEPDPSESPEEIIGGAAAKGAQLDAIGSLRYSAALDAGVSDSATSIPNGYNGLCTATLIAPRLIVTAKHCAARATTTTLPMSDSQTLYFAIGPDTLRPKRAVRVVRTWLSPMRDEGYVGYGSDVAVMQLETAIDDVTPLKVANAHLDASAKGSRFSVVGFGYRDRAMRKGTRRAGTLTLQATAGRFMGSVFGSKEQMVAFARNESPEAFTADDADRLYGLWDRTLLPQYEAFFGLAYGDSQPCSGDSGAPLLARVGDELVVAGVVSGSHKLSNRTANPCSVLGQVYATFGPLVQTTFDVAQNATGLSVTRTRLTPLAAGSSAQLPPKVDVQQAGDAGVTDAGSPLTARCQGLSKEGICVDGTVQRCIAEAEGPPRPTRVDCTLLLSTCAMSGNVAECADVPTTTTP